MAITYTVTEERAEEMEFSGESDQIKITWNKTYFVEVAVSGGDTLQNVSIFNVMRASGLPIVNRSVYLVDGKIIPFVVCRSKTARRDPKRLSRYEVKTKWSTNSANDQSEADNEPQAKPNNATDIAPRVETTLGEAERVVYEDQDGKACLTPNKNYYDEPFVERLATITHRITQHEPFITYEQMQERKLKVNSALWKGHPRYDWLIEDVEAHEVDIVLADDSTQTVALVTYTITLSPFLYGWKEERALIDSEYIESGDTKLFRDDELLRENFGFITAAGAKHAGTVPLYDQWEIQGQIDFDSFLRV